MAETHGNITEEPDHDGEIISGNHNRHIVGTFD